MSEKLGASSGLAPIGQSVVENRSVLKELNSKDLKHSPLHSKSVGAVNKSLSSTPSAISKVQKTTPVKFSTIHSGETTAAGTANCEDNSSVSSLHVEVDSVLDVDLYSNPMPKRLSTAFSGLREFYEADIPDLPGNLDTDGCEDPLKLGDDEALLSSFSMQNTSIFGVNKFKEVNTSMDFARLQIPPMNDTDTALSSDNEIYAECQSYRDSELNYEYHQLDVSEAEQYQSAFNTHENTLNADQLNTTMDKIMTASSATQIINKDHLIVQTPLIGNSSPAINSIDECEPMEVDMNSTLEMSNHTSNNTTVEADHILGQHALRSKEPTPEKLNNKAGYSNFECVEEKFEEIHKKYELKNERTVANPKEVNILLKNQEFNQNECLGIKSETKDLKEECVTTSSVAAPLMLSNPNNIPTSTITEAAERITAIASPLKINVTTSLDESFKKSSLSPSFPLKSTNDASKFPSSPTQILLKQSPFLEKSIYTEYSRDPMEKSSENVTINITSSSPQKMNITPTQTTTSKPSSGEVTPNQKADKTFNGDVNQSTASITPSDERFSNSSARAIDNTQSPLNKGSSEKKIGSSNKRRTFNVNENAETIQTQIETNDQNTSNVVEKNDDKRRTFNIDSGIYLPEKTPTAFPLKSIMNENAETIKIQIETNDQSTLNVVEIKDDKRRTLDIDAEISLAAATSTVFPLKSIINEQLKQLNQSFEPMEVDESFTALTSPQCLKVKEQDQQPIASKISSSPHTHSSTSPVILIENSVVSSNVAVPSILTETQISNIQDSLIMPPPLESTNKKRTSLNEAIACSREVLSAKEQTKSDSKDEKDVSVDKSALEEASYRSNPFSLDSDVLLANESISNEFTDEDFQNNDFVLQQSDFDFLLTKGSGNVPADRSSLLLRFDPLIGQPVPAGITEQQQHSLQKILQQVSGGGTRFGNGNEKICLKPQTIEEEVQGDSNCSQPVAAARTLCAKVKGTELRQLQEQQKKTLTEVATAKRHANMSVDVIKDINNIDNECTKNNYELSNSQSDEKQSNYKMDELEKKIKNEVLKTEDIEKKLKEAEQREEALIKRITEKDKQILKMSNVTESYEKSIAELIAEKEQLVQSYEKQLVEVSTDRDSNYRHLMSLETTFSDLHVKYEKSKEMTSQLKSNEEALLAKERQYVENLRKQEQRYEKMKNHAMQQLDIANKKLESMKKEYAIETTKLKAQLKKEEVSRASLNEQLQQKTRENEELVKICDELINGQGS